MPEHELLIENAVDNVGRIITDLRPSILDHQGLWAALEWQAQEFVQSAELELAWHMDVPATLHLPEPAAIAVFRIFQEMLSNVGRHAQASAIDIAIDVQDDVLQLRVRDNGVGATRQALEAPTAYGVMGMRERKARQLGPAEHHQRAGAGLVPAIADSSGAVMNSVVRVLIGDDHRIVREGLKQVLGDRPMACPRSLWSPRPPRATRCWSWSPPCKGPREHWADLVLLDIAMPGHGAGPKCCRRCARPGLRCRC